MILTITNHHLDKPEVVGIVKQYPLYRQIFEDTKNRNINLQERVSLGIKQTQMAPLMMIEVEIPFEKLY